MREGKRIDSLPPLLLLSVLLLLSESWLWVFPVLVMLPPLSFDGARDALPPLPLPRELERFCSTLGDGSRAANPSLLRALLSGDIASGDIDSGDILAAFI